MAATVQSSLRVFLSADLVGSTKLTNRLNHQELLDKYRSRLHVIEKLRTQDPALVISPEIETAAVLESLAVSTDDFDWATVVYNFYQAIHTEFVSALGEMNQPEDIHIQLDKSFKPWKAVGDELIYAVPCTGRRELHHVVVAFLCAVREVDSKIRKTLGDVRAVLRIKGAAWVAGFPVRNREIALPPDDRPDFLGPDMDTGFRIGKCTRSGMLVVSVELAELLGECQGKYAPMLGKIVGWEDLKGVWNDQRYPVVWIDFPDSHPAAEAQKAIPFSLWDQEESPWCKVWEDGRNPKRQLSDLANTLRDLRQALPKSLGLVDPYIVDDPLETSGLPPEHKQILDLLQTIEAHKKEYSRQEADDTERGDRPIEEEVENVKSLVTRTTKPPVEQSE